MRPTLEAKDLDPKAVVDRGRTTTGTVELTSTVPAHPASIALVRNTVRGFADGWRIEGWGPASFDAERSADLALVFSELLTNAVEHSGCAPDGLLEVRLALDDGEVRGSVTDPGRGFNTRPGGMKPRVDGGLGLFIVGRLVRVWGVRLVPRGNQVWFEL